MSQAVGDIDFYPNGGEHQPGCGDHISRFLSIVYNTGMEGIIVYGYYINDFTIFFHVNVQLNVQIFQCHEN